MNFNKDNIISTLLFIVFIFTYSIFAYNVGILGTSILIIAFTIMALSYHKSWMDLANALIGIVISIGSIIFGVLVYFNLPNNPNENHAQNEFPTMRLDFLLVAPIFALFALFLTLMYYYNFRDFKNKKLEKYFSFSLLISTIFIAIIEIIVQN